MSENFNILNDYPEDKYNLLIPVKSIQEANPIYRIIVNQVQISTCEEDKEIYNEKNAQGNAKWALTHKALLKLMMAANGQIVETAKVRPKVCEKCIDIVKVTQQAPKCGECACNVNVACRVTMKFPELSGGWRIVQATREIDFSLYKVKQDKNDTGYSPAQLNRMKEFAAEHAESKAMSRCIRKALNIKNAYALDELKKPFVVAYPVLDARDADVKKALIAGSLAATNLLYGSGLQVPQLTAGSANTENGEVIEADYEAEPAAEMPTAENTPPAQQKRMPWEGSEEKCHCSKCGVDIAQNVYEYSTKQFGAPLCMKCQQATRKGGK